MPGVWEPEMVGLSLLILVSVSAGNLVVVRGVSTFLGLMLPLSHHLCKGADSFREDPVEVACFPTQVATHAFRSLWSRALSAANFYR